jgi:hypothetical protein
MNRSSARDPLSLAGQERSSPTPSLANGHESGEAQSSRHILPRDLDAAIKHLDDRELERLILAALQERERRKLPVPEESKRKSQTKWHLLLCSRAS